jgi:hypothetical protein
MTRAPLLLRRRPLCELELVRCLLKLALGSRGLFSRCLDLDLELARCLRKLALGNLGPFSRCHDHLERCVFLGTELGHSRSVVVHCEFRLD